MEKKFETNFIAETREKMPFIDTPAQNFFKIWCLTNDSITPYFLSRESWEKKFPNKILEKDGEGRRILFIPKDLHLWEIVNIIREIDADTFPNKPEKQAEREKKIRALGDTFEKAGLYILEYMPILKEGAEIAENIAYEFYHYGLSLQNKERGDEILSLKDKEKLDKWFLGEEAYNKRIKRLGENPSEEEKEKVRKRLIQTYFKALAKQGYEENSNLLEIKVGPIKRLQDITKRQIINKMETPEREMESAIFERGVEKLMQEIEQPNGINWFLEKLKLPLIEKKLCESLHISELKKELEKARETGNLKQISKKELEFAKKINKAVNSFPYSKFIDSPAKIIEAKALNCLGASILGGRLLEELDIKYLTAIVPEHSATVLLTTDGKAYWQDFTPGKMKDNYREIEIKGAKESITFDNWNPYRHIKGKLKVFLLKPKEGLQYSLLGNLGMILTEFRKDKEASIVYKKGIKFNPRVDVCYNGLAKILTRNQKYEEAVEVYKEAIKINPNNYSYYNGLGNIFAKKREYGKAIQLYEKGIEKNPDCSYFYNGLGNVLVETKQYAMAAKMYLEGIKIEPENIILYNGLGNAFLGLGEYRKAVKVFNIFIELWDGDEFWTKRAEAIVKSIKDNEKYIKN